MSPSFIRTPSVPEENGEGVFIHSRKLSEVPAKFMTHTNSLENKIAKIRHELAQQQMDGWLLYDYRHSNPLVYQLLEIPNDKMTTRRFFYWIPKTGEPIKIVPLIEPYTLDHLPGKKLTYKGWQELEQLLFSIAMKNVKIAMEYSPYNALPNISKVDAGTIELLQQWGASIVSSANLLQAYTSVWSSNQLQSHLEAAEHLNKIVGLAWTLIEDALQKGTSIDEYHVQQFILEEMEKADCTAADAPTCSVNAHSADPHYHPTAHSFSPIRRGDFILIDLWCKKKQLHSVYADITRVGVAAPQPTQKQKEIFTIVKKAQEVATAMVKDRFENQLPLQGWEVDQACRDVIQAEGYGDYFIHRTGHNIGEEVHSTGANLDNFETHDYRELLPGTCFSVEPGIYLPGEFGVRLEYDIYLDFSRKIRVTGGVQKEIVCFNLK